MGMVFKYVGSAGTYIFNDETTMGDIGKDKAFDSRGRASGYNHSWTLKTVLQAATQSAISALVTAFEVKMVDEGTLTLYNSDGTTTTPHTLTNCRINSIKYPESTGAEYANKRTVEIQITGFQKVAQTDNLITFTESLALNGGGARMWGYENVQGLPIQGIAAQNTFYYGHQSGSASGYNQYPTAPAPLFPYAELLDRRSSVKSTNYINDELVYNISWNYSFRSPTELSGDPNTWLPLILGA